MVEEDAIQADTVHILRSRSNDRLETTVLLLFLTQTIKKDPIKEIQER